MSAAFKALYQVAQHPLLSTQHTPEVPPVRTACASSCSEYGPSERDDSCSLAPVDRNIMGGASLAELQPEEVLQASKCGSLLHLLRSSGPAVVASSFPAVLDIVGMLLAHSGISSARLDAKSRLDDCMNVSSAFAAGKAQVVLVQQQVALKYPMLDLSRAELCIFYDSGLNRSVRSILHTAHCISHLHTDVVFQGPPAILPIHSCRLCCAERACVGCVPVLQEAQESYRMRVRCRRRKRWRRAA